MSSQQGKIRYSDITERNIFDTRFTGCGKTTSALEYIADVVNENRPVIVLMQSYERLENNYHPQLVEAKVPTLIFKGKTQEGLCIHAKDYSKLWGAGTPPKNECKKCPDSTKCGYQKQLADLTGFSKSDEGFCVLTTEKNFNKVYSEIKDLNPVLIIDDISLSSVVMPESEITSYDLESLVRHLQKQGSQAQNLHELALMLKDYTKENKIAILTFITLNEGQLHREMQQFLTDNTGHSDLPNHKGLEFLYRLILAVKSGGKLYFYSEYNRLKIVADESFKFDSIRVCYLNATPSIKDKYCIERLGDNALLEAKAKESKKYFIFQISDSANSKTSVLSSDRLPKDFLSIVNVIKAPLSFINQKMLLFSFNDLFGKWASKGVLSGIDYSPEIYFGSNTRGTNDYKDYPISFIIGNPNFPAQYFLHPAFEDVWKPDDVFEEEKKKDPYTYRVDWNVSEPEARVNLLQMIGRNLRDSPNNPDAFKVVVVFSDIDIKEDCKKQNGATVVGWKIRDEMPVITGKKKGKKPIFDGYKKVCQATLKPLIQKKVEEHVDKILDENPDELHSVQAVALELQAQIKIYDVESVKKMIKKIYVCEVSTVNNGGKSIPTAFIIKKKSK